MLLILFLLLIIPNLSVFAPQIAAAAESRAALLAFLPVSAAHTAAAAAQTVLTASHTC
jgi:hypothetical protein